LEETVQLKETKVKNLKGDKRVAKGVVIKGVLVKYLIKIART